MHSIIHHVTLSNPRVDKQEGTLTFDASMPVGGLGASEVLTATELVVELRPEKPEKSDETTPRYIGASVALLLTREDGHQLPEAVAEEFTARSRQVAPVKALEEIITRSKPKNRG